MRDGLYNAMCSATERYGSFDFPDAATGLANYINSSYISSITYYRSLLSNYTLTNNHINSVVSSISSNKPVLVMIGYDAYANSSQNVLSNSRSSLHALAVKRVRYCNSGTSNDYLIAIDPWNGNTVELIWDTYNSTSRSYFAIYGIGLVNISVRP